MPEEPNLDVETEANRVLTFWFEALEPKQWWRTDHALDEEIAVRFGDLHAALIKDVGLAWLATPQAALAAVIVLDQFSRNIFRGRAQAFTQDEKACALAEQAIAKGHDLALPEARRHFLYMPFMHSERAEDQERAMELFATLGEGDLKHAREHKAVIDRFGRFPKRNAALGRKNTAEEAAYLAENEGGAV